MASHWNWLTEDLRSRIRNMQRFPNISLTLSCSNNNSCKRIANASQCGCPVGYGLYELLAGLDMMHSAPREVRLKRKRNEEPPNALVLAGSDRAGVNGGEKPQKRLRYQLQSNNGVSSSSSGKASSATNRGESATENVVQRLFHLRRVSGTRSNKRNNDARSKEHHHLPVIEESLRTSDLQVSGDYVQHESLRHDGGTQMKVKRPGKGSAVHVQQDMAGSAHGILPEKRDDVQALADSMHEFAMKELAKESQSPNKNRPKMSAAQSRLRHQRVVERTQAAQIAQAEDVETMDFVYDTYILAPSDAMDVDIQDSDAILVIEEEDEEYWQSFIHDDDDDEDDQQDDVDEDENAEDHYGAEYPEDELASDDEFGRNAYCYRNRAASDDEQYDLRDEDYEDDHDDNDDRNEHNDNYSKHHSSMIRRFERLYLDKQGTATQND